MRNEIASRLYDLTYEYGVATTKLELLVWWCGYVA